jgi:hypothetical protein
LEYTTNIKGGEMKKMNEAMPAGRQGKYIGIVGARKLPLESREKVRETVRKLLEAGYYIASGGAIGADDYALEEVIREGKSFKGIVFAAWDHFSGFPNEVQEHIKEFARKGGKIEWGQVYPNAPRELVVAGLLARNRKLVEHVSGLVAFPYGESRGTRYTVNEAIKRGIPVKVMYPNGEYQYFNFKPRPTPPPLPCRQAGHSQTYTKVQVCSGQVLPVNA